MSSRWNIHAPSPHVSTLAQALALPLPLAHVLCNRGHTTPATATAFLHKPLAALHDPTLLPGIADAVVLLQSALRQQRRITIHGDYDVDGISGTALLYHTLSRLRAKVSTFIPSRHRDGYGIRSGTIKRLAATTDLLLTVDCGSACPQEISLAHQLHLQTIVTDHHQPGATLPTPTALIHPPARPGAYPFLHLSGAGVALKLAQALLAAHGGSVLLSDLYALATLGTIGDVVPLTGENRILVHHGLTSLLYSQLPGVRALLEVTHLAKKNFLSAGDIAFQLAPRINAVGRLACAQTMVELLTTSTPSRAYALAAYADRLNQRRKHVQARMLEEARLQVQSSPSAPALVVVSPSFHPGIVGTVAGQLSEEFHKPAIVLAPTSLSTLTGSARAPTTDTPLHTTLASLSPHLTSHGGHAQAAGLSLPSQNLADFKQALSKALASPRPGKPLPWAEATVQPWDWDVASADAIALAGPFGKGNPEPLFQATDVSIAYPKRMGDGSHLTFSIPHHGIPIRCVAFKMGKRLTDLSARYRYHLLYRITVNDWKARRTVELQIEDFERAS
jgi:single-stranded-DNA-specific exonuclease